MAAHCKSLPTSRHPPVEPKRPLSVFGPTFQVEVSTALTFNPDTVLRASIGRSLQELLRADGKLLSIKKMAYGLQGKHRLSSTTIDSIRRSAGPMGEAVSAVLFGDKPLDSVPELQQSDWEILDSVMADASSNKDFVRRAVAQFKEFDTFARQLTDRVRLGDHTAAKRDLLTLLGDFSAAEGVLKFEVSARDVLLVETSLRVVAALEAPFLGGKAAGGAWQSAALQLLAPGRKPIGHWLLDLAGEVRCKDLVELSNALVRKGAVLHGRPISHDTLKAWSSMRNGMLMPLKACDALRVVVSDETKSATLRARFVLARYLCFLCDFLLSCAESQAQKWSEAQKGLRLRYDAILKEVLATCG